MTDQLPTDIGPVVVASDGLADRAARGTAVTLGGQLARAVLQMASVVVLARLLVPSDYGLLALVLVVVGIGEIVRDFGLSTASIQAKSLSRGQRDALFFTNAGLGVVLSILAVVLAGPISALFDRPQLLHMIQILAVTFTINGLAAQYRADLNRRMRFGRLAMSDVGGQALGLGVGIVCAALGAGYWSLVAQQLTQTGTTFLILVIGAGWLPRWPRTDRDIGALLRLGAHFGATQGLYYVMNNIDTVTIGVRFSSNALGLYNRAFQAITTPLNQVRSPASTVAVPVLSRLRDDPERAGRYLMRGQLALGYTVVAGLAVVAGAAHPVVLLILGSRWQSVVPILALLAVAGCLSTLSFVGLWVYLSRGLARELMRYTAVSVVLQIICILVGSEWGVTGVAAGYAVAAALEWPLSLYWLSRRTSIPLRGLVGGAGRVMLCGLLAGLAALGVSHLLDSTAVLVQVAAAFAAGAAVYGVLVLIVAQVRRDVIGVVQFGRRMMRRSSPA